MSVTPLRTRDKYWSRLQSAFAGGPVPGLTADRVRDHLRHLAEVDPGHRYFRRFDPDGLRWDEATSTEELHRRIDEIVVESPSLALDALDGATERIVNQPIGTVPFRVEVGNEIVVYHNIHALGDAHNFVQSRWLIDPEAPEVKADRHDDGRLTRRAMAHALREPGTLWQAKKAYDADRARFAEALAAGPSTALHADGASRIRSVSVMSDTGNVAELNRWRKTQESRPGRTAIRASVIQNEMLQRGLVHPTAGPTVLVDLRRYLPGQGAGLGNFVGSIWIPEAAPTPQDIAAKLKADLKLGVPLVAEAKGLRAFQKGWYSMGDFSSPTPAPRTMTFVDSLPWNRPTDFTDISCVAAPGGPSAITVCVGETNGATYLTAAFLDDAFDAAEVKAALHASLLVPA
ncbi:hypothetical protein [Nocardioides sp. YIM 152588]|uniref:hypothetical protein n=1 Tax=Nocardioides sp. YIM 152588 TaxID=3158259 RepID=UPI0032E44214